MLALDTEGQMDTLLLMDLATYCPLPWCGCHFKIELVHSTLRKLHEPSSSAQQVRVPVREHAVGWPNISLPSIETPAIQTHYLHDWPIV